MIVAKERLNAVSGDELAAEAARYLEAVHTFASLGCDPHAEARTRAARARTRPARRRGFFR